MDLYEALQSKASIINAHFERIMKHLLKEKSVDPCIVSIKIKASQEDDSIVLDARISSVIPNKAESESQLGKIGKDDKQLTLFD